MKSYFNTYELTIETPKCVSYSEYPHTREGLTEALEKAEWATKTNHNAKALIKSSLGGIIWESLQNNR